jgi:hypothetical protein
MGKVDETRRGRSHMVVPCRGAGRWWRRGAGSPTGPRSRSRSVTRGRGLEETGESKRRGAWARVEHRMMTIGGWRRRSGDRSR